MRPAAEASSARTRGWLLGACLWAWGKTWRCMMQLPRKSSEAAPRVRDAGASWTWRAMRASGSPMAMGPTCNLASIASTGRRQGALGWFGEEVSGLLPGNCLQLFGRALLGWSAVVPSGFGVRGGLRAKRPRVMGERTRAGNASGVVGTAVSGFRSLAGAIAFVDASILVGRSALGPIARYATWRELLKASGEPRCMRRLGAEGPRSFSCSSPPTMLMVDGC